MVRTQWWKVSRNSLTAISSTVSNSNASAPAGTWPLVTAQRLGGVNSLWPPGKRRRAKDASACRMTGMTRFACFRVASGRLVEPLPVMRFDDSFLRMFGEGLVGLSDRAELIADGDTYAERRLASTSTPGALIQGWRLTL